MLKALRLLQQAKKELASNGTDEIDLYGLDTLIENVRVSYEAKVGFNRYKRIRRQLSLGTTLSRVYAKSESAAANLEYLIEVYCQKKNNSDLSRSLGRFLGNCKNQRTNDLVAILLEPIITNRFKKI